ncbi:MAG: Rieske 2Fe-2S domain-containing protein [Planctomycetales bacterium]|jgi:phenylpropionate dioxygenase-like ring-hydroxylating dioxygenase large terminal subunit
MNEIQIKEHPTEGPAEFELLRRHWLVACTDRELSTRPLSRTVLDVPLVVFRSGQQVTALLDRCPHRNVPLSSGRVVAGCVQCPYHGWQFDGDGRCVFRPGVIEDAPVAVSVPCFPTVLRDGLVWVCLEPGNVSEPVSRPWHADSLFGSFTWVDSINASLGDALENLLDGTHTPFVHSGIVRSPTKQQTFSAIVRVDADSVEAEYLDEGKQAGWLSRLFERNRTSSFGRFLAPCLAELEYRSNRGAEFVLNSCFTPESDGRLRVYSTIFIRRSLIPLPVKRLVITPLFRRVLKQDQRILELQQKNIRRFGTSDYVSWSGDLLRGWIDTRLRTGKLPDGTAEQRIDFRL